METIHCNVSYHRKPFEEVASFANGVKTGYYGHNPPFTVLTITEVAFEGLINEYIDKHLAYVNGGLSQKGDFLVAKTNLMDGLDLLANETDKVANGDSEIIILAAFEPTKTKGEGSKPGQCVVTVKRGMTGELISNCALVPEAKHYGCIAVQGGPLPTEIALNAAGKLIFTAGMVPGPGPQIAGLAIDLTDQREKHFANLLHDTEYFFYYYAVNAMGVGPLSDPVSMVCW